MTTLSAADLREISARLEKANHEHMRRYPGETGARQPVHTVYGGAQLFKSDSAVKLGTLARRALEEFAPDAKSMAQALGWSNAALAERVFARVKEKLTREPVEDFRIDFEDGYGNRPDAEEDGHAASCARDVSRTG